jgi:DNA-binding XRE family transcriptional regulator
MHYTQLFKNIRESKGLTHDVLAKKAGCHRNTVINVESGRPVKFKTIAGLMAQMGYDLQSPEVKSMALLWLEGVSGINLTQPQSANEAHERIAQYRATEKEAIQLLGETITARHLTVPQIYTLYYAAQRTEVINILESIRKLGEIEAQQKPVV